MTKKNNRMKKINSKDAKEIGEDIGINWKSVRLTEDFS